MRRDEPNLYSVKCLHMTIVHLVFKTHLDIGFTGYAADVVQTYFHKFIPQAVALAERTRDRGRPFSAGRPARG